MMGLGDPIYLYRKVPDNFVRLIFSGRILGCAYTTMEYGQI